MAISFGRVEIYIQWGVPFRKVIRFFDQGQVVLQGHVNYFNCCITTTPIDTKLGKVVPYYKKIQRIKSHKSLNTCSPKFTWSIKNILSPLAQYLWLPNVAYLATTKLLLRFRSYYLTL